MPDDQSCLYEQEIKLDIDTIVLKGKRWGEGNPVRCIALHGWLDNCASFDLLIPHLKGMDVVALDLAGHGKSGHRGGLGTYNIWQDIAEIIAASQKLGWEKFALLGHSRGAMISTLITGTFPEKITHLGLIESILPHANTDKEAPSQLASAVNNVLRLYKRERHYYASFDDAVKARANGFIPLAEGDAKTLALRGVSHDGVGYYWANDPLLMAPSEIKLTHDQIFSFVENIPIQPALVIASDGLLIKNDVVAEWLNGNDKITTIQFHGHHHLHMSQKYQEIADFLLEYYVL